MAWQEHIAGRHAMLARRFLMFHFSDGAPGTVPQWVPMASELLRRAAPGRDPALALLLVALDQPGL
eukprot:164255-Chlamydomonas_euryale.AAC.1